MVTLEAGT